MRYIKTYEQELNNPKIGDYVICKEESKARLDKFLSFNIGRILLRQDGKYKYIVTFDNIPEDILDRFSVDGERAYSRAEILHFSPNKEDLELYIRASKYNI